MRLKSLRAVLRRKYVPRSSKCGERGFKVLLGVFVMLDDLMGRSSEVVSEFRPWILLKRSEFNAWILDLDD